MARRKGLSIKRQPPGHSFAHHRLTSGTGAALGGRLSGYRMEYTMQPGFIRYQDPTGPKTGDKPPAIPGCRICGHIFLRTGYLDETGACKGKTNCAERAAWPDA